MVKRCLNHFSEFHENFSQCYAVFFNKSAIKKLLQAFFKVFSWCFKVFKHLLLVHLFFLQFFLLLAWHGFPRHPSMCFKHHCTGLICCPWFSKKAFTAALLFCPFFRMWDFFSRYVPGFFYACYLLTVQLVFQRLYSIQ